jgi:hypothetical protein
MTLWDMERIYEGIYQYLEFFAILTEHGSWKNMMTEWQITSELVTLLEELHANIPRSSRSQDAAREASGHKPKSHGSSQPSKPVSVERPYDTEPASLPTIAASSRPPHNSADNYPTGIAEDEPSHFEWRNLKKLAVLVLSSLAWQNRGVQLQLATADLNGVPGRGLRALISCMVHDDFNPYVKEHALMALRFALEGCEENQRIFCDITMRVRHREMELGAGSGKVVMDGVEIPPEVLDLNGFETVVDANGHVQLRKKARN